MLVLHVEANTVNELIAATLKALHINLMAPASDPPPPAEPAPVTNIEDARKKRGRPGKDVAVAVPPAAPATLQPPAPPPTASVEHQATAAAGGPALTKEDIRTALHSVTVRVVGEANESAGLKRAYEVLSALG